MLEVLELLLAPLRQKLIFRDSTRTEVLGRSLELVSKLAWASLNGGLRCDGVASYC